MSRCRTNAELAPNSARWTTTRERPDGRTITRIPRIRGVKGTSIFPCKFVIDAAVNHFRGKPVDIALEIKVNLAEEAL